VAKVLLDKLLSAALLPAIHQAQPRFAAASLRVYQVRGGGEQRARGRRRVLRVVSVRPSPHLSFAASATPLRPNSTAFPSAIELWSAAQALVVKYDAGSGRVEMPAHGDFGLLTLNVALNAQGSDYEGGGTWCGKKLSRVVFSCILLVTYSRSILHLRERRRRRHRACLCV
jgi:hypothetical protein